MSYPRVQESKCLILRLQRLRSRHVFKQINEAESPSEAESRWSSQNIPRLLWNSELHYNVHKCEPLSYAQPDETSSLSHVLSLWA